MGSRKFHLIGACSCWGAQIRTCERGPEDLLNSHQFPCTHELLFPQKRALNEEIPLSQSLPLIYDFNLQLVQAVRRAKAKNQFPVVIGGDHSIAVGTWNSFDVPFGLLWIDAHMDSHTLETTPSGAYHGMPLAGLLGHGTPELSQLIHKHPVLKPQNLALIGVRSYESGEAALLKKLNVRIYFMDEVKKRGLDTIIPEALAHITQNVSHFGISLDLDAFSPEIAPGVGSPEPDGLTLALLPHLHRLGHDPRLLALEIVEYNPERDIHHRTRELIVQILKEVM